MEQGNSENATHLIQKLEDDDDISTNRYKCNLGNEESSQIDRKKFNIDFSNVFLSETTTGYHGSDKKVLFNETNKLSSPRRLSLDDR